ncbi:hypothetical protein [Mesoplasma corruscae]|uniref:ABC transporter ATP-binding protein n=1 Tax=Mesoplasma corruscae TaxID=216874 RepID=A0A2S5RFY8_9MOLU|nr:hypothetical protein [Mesoplasma corruscae]PPE06244.1 ABC transporter ATP-binding protein [Mesoplasma corruscae]
MQSSFKKNQFLNMWNNIKLLSTSVLKNLRTYLYLIIFPICIVTLVIAYKVVKTENAIYINDICSILILPSFMVIFLVNITISEWKNSVFLKRIHSAGISRNSFLFSMFIFNFMLGIVSFIFTSLYSFWLTSSFFPINQGGKQMGFAEMLFMMMTFKTAMGLIMGVSFCIVISICIGTIVSGVFKSVALSQSIASILMIFAVISSDVFISPEIIAVSRFLVNLCYISPYKHSVWISILLSSDANFKWIYHGAAEGRVLGVSFGLKEWLPVFSSAIYLTLLTFLSIFSFKWNGK